MFRCLYQLVWMVCTFTVLAFPVLAQAPEKAVVKSAFDTDPRLDRHITLERTGVPMDRLFMTLSSADLELDVNPNCAVQRLQIALHDRPLRTLLRAIAELMPGSWTPNADGSGYRFAMSDRAVAERDAWWQLYNSQHDAALEAQRKFVLERLEERPKPHKVYQMSAK